ncbi:MAG TPA: LysR family transcriptional regulator [Pseudomonas sp.]|jgi:DNA-binding transcriptional LysR family regulator|nr:LysR family transcriptional regulator [Pseudomonas sp.]
MDIELARTFLEIARGGSFIAAAERLHVTQTAITARVQKLEAQLGCALFVRNRAGARLTANGEKFIGYATQLVQSWEAARRDLPLPEGCDTSLAVGGEMSLCNPLMLAWVAALRERIPEHAIRAEVGENTRLQERLELGMLDCVLVYHPSYWPGLQVEPVLEERLIQVRHPARPEPYVYVDWGEHFRERHDAALPERARAPLAFNLGPLALQYLLQNGGCGYFRSRVVEQYLASGALERVPQAPEFSYPIYLAYSRARDTPVLRQAIEVLREVLECRSDWSQRWDPVI